MRENSVSVLTLDDSHFLQPLGWPYGVVESSPTVGTEALLHLTCWTSSPTSSNLVSDGKTGHGTFPLQLSMPFLAPRLCFKQFLVSFLILEHSWGRLGEEVLLKGFLLLLGVVWELESGVCPSIAEEACLIPPLPGSPHPSFLFVVVH